MATAASVPMPQAASLMVNVFDGSRQPITPGGQLLIRIFDGNQNEVVTQYVKEPSTLFRGLQVFDNFGDNYTAVVSADGYKQAGFIPIHVARNTVQSIDLMLLRNDANFNFRDSQWAALQQSHPALIQLLAHGAATDAAAQDRYADLMENRPGSLASFLNLTTAMAGIQLPVGTPLDYLKELIWDETFAQDRFFAYADRKLVDQVKQAAQQGEFAPEIDPQIFHPSATCSYKQIQFGEANVQLTFHEGDARQIDGVDCVKVEPDIDYYKDLGAHFLLEVVVNAVTSTLTDPKMVYVLRWIAGRHAGVPEFNPPYVIV
jgi:hypothetical protein